MFSCVFTDPLVFNPPLFPFKCKKIKKEPKLKIGLAIFLLYRLFWFLLKCKVKIPVVTKNKVSFLGIFGHFYALFLGWLNSKMAKRRQIMSNFHYFLLMTYPTLVENFAPL